MIPQTLQIKNFLSYGAEIQTIDFRPYHLIYLSGKNGHGKSALLDAITWAIWGHARKVSTAVKADHGLLRLGQTQMIVILDFELEKNVYRIRREFSYVYGKATTNLEFGMINPETEQCIPLTDKTIRDTQIKIEQTIRLDYDAFVNSAFLRQGHANEFSQKSPKDRKEILGSILGLQQFDLIKKRALEKVKEAQTKKQTLQQLEEKYHQELLRKPEIEKERTQIAASLTACQKKEQDLSLTKIQLEKERAHLTEQKQQYELLQIKIEQQNNLLEDKKRTLMQLSRQWRLIHAKQRSVPDIKKINEERALLAASIITHQKTLQENLQLKQQLLTFQTKIHEQKSLLIQQLTHEKHAAIIENQKQTVMRDNTQKKVLELTEKKERYTKQIAPITQEQIDKKIGYFEKRKNFYQQCITDGKWYTNEKNNLVQKTDLVHEDDPSCPLCEQNLTIARRKFLKNKFQKREQFLTHRLARLTLIVTTLKPLLIEEHASIEQDKAHVQKAKELHALEKELTASTQEIATFEALIKKSVQQLEMHEKKEKELLTKDPVLVALQRESADVQKKITLTTYDEAGHAQQQKKHADLEALLTEYTQLQQEMIKQDDRKKEITLLIVEAKKIKKLCDDFLQEKAKLAPSSQSGQHAFEKKEGEYLRMQQELTKEKEALIEKRGSLENQYTHLQTIATELEKQKTIITDLDQTIDDYQTIAHATGKDGIQALLIEEAIPEIEQEANSLLSKLTNNQAQIFIESLRDLKKGGSKETLDIKISDPSGIRPYELFSGGEAFRIDFALRIAISKLLARRAGTALQTLIIDEGFGSQDDEGLSHIMDAIYKIQDDFEKVIVVSHLPSMKDQFPVHFIVEKGATGSHISIMEQG